MGGGNRLLTEGRQYGLDMNVPDLHRCRNQISNFSSDAPLSRRCGCTVARRPVAYRPVRHSPSTERQDPGSCIPLRDWTRSRQCARGHDSWAFRGRHGDSTAGVDYALDLPMYFVTRRRQLMSLWRARRIEPSSMEEHNSLRRRASNAVGLGPLNLSTLFPALRRKG